MLNVFSVSSFFTLEAPYSLGIGLYDEIHNKMVAGMPCTGSHELGLIAQVLSNAEGDHLEIGSAFGGSAIAAVLVKERLGLAGSVTAVDLFENYYLETVRDKKKVYATLEVAKENARRCMAHVNFVQGNSETVELGTYSTAFIDGDHRCESVLKDWSRLREIVSRYIVLHDYSPMKEGVVEACKKVIFRDDDWMPVEISGGCVVMERKP